MALETATFIPQLVPTNPTDTDPLAQFAAQTRLVKSVLQNQFPNIGTVAVTATGASMNAAALAFAGGTVTAIPANGTVASGELDLLGLINSGGTVVAGRVQLINSAGSGVAGALAIKMTSSIDATSTVTALALTADGTLTTAAALNAPSVLQAGHSLVPSGMIMMWSGSVASIPAGWVLCDGTNSTPNLLNQFIVGAGLGSGGSLYAPSATGGSSTLTATAASAGAHNHTGADGSAGAHNHGGNTAGYSLQVGDLASHSHAVTVTDPGHTHGSGGGGFIVSGAGLSLTGPGPINVFAASATANSATGITVAEAAVGSGAPHSHGVSSDGNHTHAISTDGAHTHTVTAANALPPYFALCFVMKT